MTNSPRANEFVTDTVGLISRIERRKMGKAAKMVFESVESGNAVVHIPAMVLAEILYLSEKKRIGVSLKDVSDYLRPFPNYKPYPMNQAVVETSAQITDIRELHDRLIAGTARLLDLTLISCDPLIQASAFVKTLWH